MGDLPDRWDRAAWPVISAALQARFGSRTRDEWGSVFDAVDACVTPVLDFDEAAADPVAVQRGSFVRVDDAIAPAPAPRFSRTVLPAPSAPSAASLGEIVAEWSVVT